LNAGLAKVPEFTEIMILIHAGQHCRLTIAARRHASIYSRKWNPHTKKLTENVAIVQICAKLRFVNVEMTTSFGVPDTNAQLGF
jgi:hypothetical protein